jgi:hypothetical protein
LQSKGVVEQYVDRFLKTTFAPASAPENHLVPLPVLFI